MSKIEENIIQNDEITNKEITNKEIINKEIINHKITNNETEPNPKYNRRNPFLWILHSLQRLSLVTGIICLAYVFWSSIIVVQTPQGNEVRFSTLDNLTNANYEESWLFNDTFRLYLCDIIRLGAIQTQFETNGVYDSRKPINISSFANHSGRSHVVLPDVYYYLGDLISWSQQGYSYSKYTMTVSEFDEFFNPTQHPDTDEDSPKWEEESRRIFRFSDDGFIDLEELEKYGYFIKEIFTSIRDTSLYTPLWGDRLETTIEAELNIDDITIVDTYDYGINDIVNGDRSGLDVVNNIDYAELVIDEDAVVDVYVILENGRIVLLDSILADIEFRKKAENAKVTNPNTAALRYQYVILNNLYKTTSQKFLEDYTTDYDVYHNLCRSLENTVNELQYNFGIYENLRNHLFNSNVYYVILVQIDGRETFYTNYNFEFNLSSLMAINKVEDNLDNWLFSRFGRYLKYDPARPGLESNIDISDSFIRNELARYTNIFPHNTRIWIGVDTSYLNEDAFYKGYHGFHQFFRDYNGYLTLAGFCFLIFFSLLIILTILTGRVVGEDGKPYTKLRSFDRIFTEIWLALAIATGYVLLYFGVYSSNTSSIYYGIFYYNSFVFNLIFVGCYVYVCSLAFSLFYYSLVRRIKAKSLVTDSLFMRLVKNTKKMFRATINLIVFVYNNSNLMLRYVIPTAAIVFFHIVAVLVIGNSRSGGTQFFFVLLLLIIDAVIGTLIFLAAKARVDIIAGIKKISGGDIHHKVEERGLHGDNLVLANAVNSIGNSISTAVEISMRDERLKADFITNVSHDIKTPLTSIINYVDLIKREDITNETVKNYVDILETKSQRLKQLTDDLVEASKISSGNIEYKMEKIDLTELVNQTIGEFEDKFAQRNLQINLKSNREDLLIEADSRRIWRVIENLFNNIYKYAMSNTRVYIELNAKTSGQVELSIKNISEQPLNFNADELTERFIRGDVSRSTEGSGLGLYIAKSLVELMGAEFEIRALGDLFEVEIVF